ncbi:Uncharacterized protein-like protein [Methanocorpusculum labreanum Z]|uniref:Uncharacterized protein-like protein n=1 Tax=Methanocorpusculum labreanum (strain ATCC 43576 / DSM 4855 / Z) TaxID=410358 RepID=A2SU94_METLZ|nr:DUF3236 domain-containing protein [Methanocorpusculum labreanum]ABN07900.1 Uncharacterized protein-like protein [Methanocorpusculum labreanum Z]
MNLDSIDCCVSSAYSQSLNGTRLGDTAEETMSIREYIKSSRHIVVPNHDDRKIAVINSVLSSFGLPRAVHLCIPTNSPDLTRTPAVSKALMALDITGADLVIARGRLGVPGSGSMLVIMDSRGRILSASLSPSHLYHAKSISDAVTHEMEEALVRVGFQKEKI